MSTQSHINVDRSMARVIESRGAGRYRFERFRAALILNDARFSSDALKPGQVLPDRILVRADGEEISLRRLTDGRPLVLVVGSLTCPLTISTLPTFSEMNRLYGDQVAFAFIYTREAHPGENIRQPATLTEKVEHARLLKELHGVDWPVLVDDLDGTLHHALDTKQNSVHIVDSDGRMVFRALFAGDNEVKTAIATLAVGGQPRKSQSLNRLAGPMKSIGYIDETLRRADSQAYRDVVKAVPPMAMMAALAGAFPFLDRANRGWAVSGTLMLGTAAAIVAIARLLS